MPSRTIARMLCNRVKCFCSKKSELKYNLRLNSRYCINKAFIVRDIKVEDDCLVVFVWWCDSPRVFMRMRDAIISLKSRQNEVCY